MDDRQCLQGDQIVTCPVEGLRTRIADMFDEISELRSELSACAHATWVQMDQARAAEAQAARLRAVLRRLRACTAEYYGAAHPHLSIIADALEASRE